MFMCSVPKDYPEALRAYAEALLALADAIEKNKKDGDGKEADKLKKSNEYAWVGEV